MAFGAERPNVTNTIPAFTLGPASLLRSNAQVFAPLFNIYGAMASGIYLGPDYIDLHHIWDGPNANPDEPNTSLDPDSDEGRKNRF